MSAISVVNSGLTAREVDNLIRENRFILNEDDKVIIPAGALLFQQIMLDESGMPKMSKEGEQIRSLSVVALIWRALTDTYTVARLTLAFLKGEDLFVEETCPLLPTKDGNNKYAAIHKLTRVDSRDFTLPVKEEDVTFGVQLILKAGALKEGYLSPDFSELWEESGGVWRNKPEVKEMEEIKLRQGRRRVLEICRAPFTIAKHEKTLHVNAQERLRSTGYL